MRHVDAGEVLENTGHKEKMNFSIELRRHLTHVRYNFRGDLGQIHGE
jgi:hypothetical protein